MFEKPPKDSDLSAENRRRELGIIHNAGMFDMAEDMHGNIINEATGERYTDLDYLDRAGEKPHFEEIKTLEVVDERVGDAADQWIKQKEKELEEENGLNK